MTTVEPGETTPVLASLHTFWTQTPQAICAALHCQTEGLSSEEAARRLALCGPNADADTKAEGPLRAILRRLLEPLSLILLASDLEVVADGVKEGRRTFVNVLKYVRMGASSNFGNMSSMALASIALPFLPMLPTQILLNNLLYDFSEVGIPFDDVREEATARPQLWDMGGLIRFAAIMGPLSSLFDILTFAMLALVFHAAPAEFRTAWFLESMATQILVIFIIRTNGRPWRDRPSRALASSSLIALGVAMVLPFTPASVWFGFETPAAVALVGVGVIVVLYLLSAELLKPLAFKSGRDHATI
ncbi:cation transporting ATPase C-terminal domain-containing protein [Methylocella sp.]|uniref:cation transporting ATPase C-terminal domain-containing protein n=1 Tax=Methylocella sp. TaxID=1978226 RepID=UPI0035B2B269